MSSSMSINTVKPASEASKRHADYLKKGFFSVYALLAYSTFGASILFMIFFLGNFPLIRTIDSIVGTTTTASVLINVCLISLFAFQHSLMARPFFKRWVTRLIHPAIERSTFVLVSSVVLMITLWFWQPMTELVWQVESDIAFFVLTALYLLGWAIVFASSFMINHFELFGLQQVFRHCRGSVSVVTPFTVRYLYAFVRHPLMLGFLVVLWAAPSMSTGHLLFSVTMTIYIVIAVKYLEERDLRRQIGQPYHDYQKRVPMLLPRFGAVKTAKN